MRRRSTIAYLILLSVIALCLLTSQNTNCNSSESKVTNDLNVVPSTNSVGSVFSDDTINKYTFTTPVYSGEEVVILNSNTPCFEESELTTEVFVSFSELDSLGRCGQAASCIGPELLPMESRGSIGMIKPSGWHTIRYDFVDGKYLYNRCHLIAYQLCGVNTDERNLITGTRHLNLEGMLTLENQVYSYVVSTGNHVLYRVTPWFEGNNLLSEGVEIEALSVEDNGLGVCFHVFCFNIQPGVVIDYKTGDSHAESITKSNTEDDASDYVPSDGATYILNTNTKRFHKLNCKSVQEMKAKNRKEFFGTREELIEQGYVPCGRCNP